MMKSYQQSAVSNQRISDQRSGVFAWVFPQIFLQKILSAVSKRGLRLTKVSSLLIADSRLLIAIFLFLVSCGDEGLVDPHGETTLPPPETTGFQAIDLPTAPGSAWTYVNVDTDQEFTLRVEGTRDISGTTHRQLTISAITTEEPDQLRVEAVDHLVANAYYLRIDTEFFDGFPFPISATYFSKTHQALMESAFDMYLPSIDNPGFLSISHRKHFPPRRLLDFPLEVGKEWVVFEKTAGIPVTVTRYVVSDNERVTVPAGSYTTYVVHEEVVYGDSPEPSVFLISPPAIYWIAPSVGVVQYRYSIYRASDEPSSRTFALKSVHLPLPNTD